MNPALIFAIIDGALAIVEKLLPEISRAASNGEITVEQQSQMKARVDRLRNDDAFAGPEWEQSE